MTPQATRGLDEIVRLALIEVSYRTAKRDGVWVDDVAHAIAWIEHQIKLDKQRRRPRGKYRR